jgi:hypothetical protein
MKPSLTAPVDQGEVADGFLSGLVGKKIPL